MGGEVNRSRDNERNADEIFVAFASPQQKAKKSLEEQLMSIQNLASYGAYH